MPYASVDNLNYTPLDTSRYQSPQTPVARVQSTQYVPPTKSSPIPNILTIVSAIVLVASISFAVTKTQFSSNSQASTATEVNPVPVKKENTALTPTEKQILLNEAKRRNIQLTLPDEPKVASESATKSATIVKKPVVDINNVMAADLEKIKSAIILTDVESRSAFVMSVWVPATSDTADQTSANQQEAEKALNEIEAKMKANIPVLEIARIISDKYPTVAQSISINGFNVSQTKNQLLLTQPVVYEAGTVYTNQEFVKKIFTMKKDEIKIFKNPITDGGGGKAVKVVTANESEFKTLNDWLTKKKTEYAN